MSEATDGDLAEQAAVIQRQYHRIYDLIGRSFASRERKTARGHAEPQQMYAAALAGGPVEDHGDGLLTVWSMEDILFLNKHHSVGQGLKYLGSTRPAIPLGLDGDDHRKYRRLLDPVFAARRIAVLEPRVREVASELIDRIIERGAADAYQAWCEPLPSTIFLSIMGLPMEELDRFIRFKNDVLGHGDLEGQSEEELGSRRLAAVMWIQSYFDRDLAAREREDEPRDDMIGWLLTTEVDGERLTRQEVLDILGLLMIAGLDTVTASLACFLSFFARHPEHRAKIVANPALIPTAVEELMRFESPVTEGLREILADITLPSGTTLPAGSLVLISWSAANLDPASFPNPLEVDLDRANNPHIGFASGFHRCLGSHLARMELRTALEVWHERIPHYALPADTTLAYAGNPRAPHQLPLVWHPPR